MTFQLLTPEGWTADPDTIASNLVLRASEMGAPKIVIYDEQGPGENGIGNDGIWLHPEQAEAIAHRLLILAKAARDVEQWNASLRSPDAE